MGAALHYIAQLDVVVGYTCLVLGGVTFPILLAKLSTFFGIRGKPQWDLPLVALSILWVYGCFSSAGILHTIDCERQTHHPCEEEIREQP